MRVAGTLALSLLLAGCSSVSNTLLYEAEKRAKAQAKQDEDNALEAALAEKPKPDAIEAPKPTPKQVAQAIAANQLIIPPEETFEKAGPNAHTELDYETLEGPGAVDPDAVSVPLPNEGEVVAVVDEPDLDPILDETAPNKTSKESNALKGDIESAPKAPPKNAVVIKAVAVTEVKGAPGSGNGELTAAMRQIMGQAGWPVLKSARKDALTITGKVAIGKAHEGRQLVRLTWIVARPDGEVLGDLKQENIVPEGMLADGWGDNARFASEAAAEGIFKLVQRYR